MTISFLVLNRGDRLSTPLYNTVILAADNWDDYSYKTLFHASWCGEDGNRIEIGSVKIGYVGQRHGWTRTAFSEGSFSRLMEGWFSLGQDVDYYRNLSTVVTSDVRDEVLGALQDVAASDACLTTAMNEEVFQTSLMRGVSLSAIHGQFRRVLQGLAALTAFQFSFRDPGDDQHAEVSLDFSVIPLSKPPTNVHVLIGRNGVGKTTLLNNMVSAVVAPAGQTLRARFYVDIPFVSRLLPADYFSSVVSVSFSAFDAFIPPADQPDRSRGVAYFYIGMKRARTGNQDLPPKTEEDLANDFIDSLQSCLSQASKRNRWLTAISRLESDTNFADMSLGQLAHTDWNSAERIARNQFRLMSSGHSIVLLTITKLVDTVEEKTLVLMDEPESHLHPPLLSAFTRAVSDLLHDRNGVAIIATHSPVVVQEVPRSCVWILSRRRSEGRSDRPDRETFGENVGVLTRDIFGLEVARSGFHELLQQAVNEGATFDEILNAYAGSLGFEAQAILRAMIAARVSAVAGTQ
ncbi:MAG: AAA family ATPase [Rhodocyclaceae bacterium]